MTPLPQPQPDPRPEPTRPPVPVPPLPKTPIPENHPLFRLFRGLVDHTFEIGLASPGLTDYVAGLLTRFVHMDGVYTLRGQSGRRLEEVAEMLVSAHFPETLTLQQRRAIIHKHVGDFTLFWTGVYPESLARLKGRGSRDGLIDYIRQGKKSYRLAAEAERTEPAAEVRCEAAVLEQISEQFEECVYGLGLVRRGWEKPSPGGGPSVPPRIVN
jgi:hypothetical protein